MGINKYLDISDIHVGHPKVDTELIHNNFVQYVYPYLNDDLDVMFICGDFFNSLLDMNGRSGYFAAKIIAELKALAKVHNFIIRVLRGTFTHDRYQNQHFVVEQNSSDVVAVISKLYIEHISHLGIDVLYIPGDLPYDSRQTLFDDIKKLLAQNNIDKVDLILHHGYLEHLLPKKVLTDHRVFLSNLMFKSLAKVAVLNGHVHTPSVYENFFISTGSFERLGHGEEEKKGFFLLEHDTEKNKCNYQFIENKGATLFKTIDLTNYSDDRAIEYFKFKLESIMSSFPDTSRRIYVRAFITNHILKQVLTQYVKEKYPNVIMSYEKISIKEEIDIRTNIDELPVITEDNIVEKTKAYIEHTKNISIPLAELIEVFNEIKEFR